MFDIKGEYKITLPPNPVFSGNRKIGKYFNRKIFLQGHTDRRDTDTGDRLAPVGSLSLSVYDDAPQRK